MTTLFPNSWHPRYNGEKYVRKTICPEKPKTTLGTEVMAGIATFPQWLTLLFNPPSNRRNWYGIPRCPYGNNAPVIAHL